MQGMAPSGILVIGFGNEWRGDDGAGPEVSRRIDALGLPGVQTLELHQLAPEVAARLATVERAVFVDACNQPQSVPVVIEPIETGEAGSLTSHLCDPGSLLKLSRLLYGRAPQAWMVSIAAEQFGYGAPLTQAVQCHCNEAVSRIAALLLRQGPENRGHEMTPPMSRLMVKLDAAPSD
jgi:hydrogenase maturation protease